MVEFRFEKLDAWQFAISFCDDIYEMTRRFPREEQFGLTSQIRRAAVSISANIAEGSGKTSNKDNARFIEIAYGSLMEVVSHIEIAKRQQFLSDEQYNESRNNADRLARILSGFRKHLATSTHTRP